jgi:hypothetical protein
MTTIYLLHLISVAHDQVFQSAITFGLGVAYQTAKAAYVKWRTE